MFTAILKRLINRSISSRRSFRFNEGEIGHQVAGIVEIWMRDYHRSPYQNLKTYTYDYDYRRHDSPHYLGLKKLSRAH